MSATGKIIGWSIFGIIAAGAIYVGVGVFKMMKVCFKFGGIKLNGFFDDNNNSTINPLGAKWFKADVTMKIYNPSYLKATISTYNLVVTINGNQVSVLQGDAPIVITPNGWGVITLTIPIDLKGGSSLFKGNFLSLIASKKYDQININISGTVTATLGISYPIPLDITKTMQDIIDSASAPTDPNAPPCGS